MGPCTANYAYASTASIQHETLAIRVCQSPGSLTRSASCKFKLHTKTNKEAISIPGEGYTKNHQVCYDQL